MLLGTQLSRQRRILRRIDVVDLEVACAGDALRRELDSQSLLHLRRRRLRARQVARRATADEPRLDLRLHQHVALAIRHRNVLLVLDVGESDPRDLPDFDAAVFHLRADVEALHRLVEVGFDRDALLQEAPRADDRQDDHARGDRADHEQAELEVVRSLAHAAAASGSRWKNWRTHGSVARVAQHARIAFGDDALLALVEHDHAIGDREDARELVRDDDERHAEVLGQAADQRVERRRRDGIEARRWLVEEQDHRIERHCARDRRALLHAARDRDRQMSGELLEPHQRELHPADQVDRLGRQFRVFLQRQAHVLEQRHRAEQRARLVHDADLAQDRRARVPFRRGDVVAIDEDVPGLRRS